MENLIIRECEPEDVEAVHQLDLDWESEGVTYGFGPSSPDETYDLYVRETYRSAGVGGRLVERMKEIAGRNGIRRFRVHSATMDLDRVLKFYRNHGFKTWCLEMFI